ncbi:MAG TPA: hypothetical protein PK711_12280 [Bacteroidales bacterium]|nr:hypothetical protein [Bacteroidales bacterium]
MPGVTVKDDRKGFDPECLEFPGNGLVNMKKRMEEIGEKLLIRSKTEEGTEILLDVTM